ncbi:hypothetical protein VB005_00252 [Metarhizium brunneum]
MSAKSVSLTLVWPILALPALVSGMVGYHTAGLRYNSTHSFCASNCRADDVYYTDHGEACFMPDAYVAYDDDMGYMYCKGGKFKLPSGSVNIAGSDSLKSCWFLPDERFNKVEIDGKLVISCGANRQFAAVDTSQYRDFETHQQVVEALKALTEEKTEEPKTEKTKAAKPTQLCYGRDDCKPVWD